MCCHEIHRQLRHLKFKTRLSWVTAVLKMFVMEFNCVGNHFLTCKSFSHKFLWNHFLVSTFLKLYLRKYKISKAAFLENTSQQLPIFIIWFRVSPNRKYYFISETYLKPSQTSKMKLFAAVVNASRDVFRTVFSIQSVFRISRMGRFLQT